MEGIAKDVPIHIDDHYIPTDFLVIDMGEDECDPPIILGRPFLNTTKAIIYIGTGEIHFQFPSEKVRHHLNSNYMIEEEPKKNRSRRRRRTRHQKKKNVVDGWADYEGEVSKFEDRYPDEKNTVKEEVPAEEEIVIPDTLLQVTVTYRAGMETKDKIRIESCTGQSTCGAIRCTSRLLSKQQGPVQRT